MQKQYAMESPCPQLLVKCGQLVEFIVYCLLDSPAIPPSANCHQLFRGFSFVSPTLLEVIAILPTFPLKMSVCKSIRHDNNDKYVYFQEGDKNGGFESMDTDSGVSLFFV